MPRQLNASFQAGDALHLGSRAGGVVYKQFLKVPPCGYVFLCNVALLDKTAAVAVASGVKALRGLCLTTSLATVCVRFCSVSLCCSACMILMMWYSSDLRASILLAFLPQS